MFDPNDKEMLARYIKFGEYYFEKTENLIPSALVDACFFYGYLQGVIDACRRANPQLENVGTPREVIYQLKHLGVKDDDLVKTVIGMALRQKEF